MLLVLVTAGFAPTFFARSANGLLGPLPLPVLVHGVAGTAWVLLFAAQTALVAAARVAWHRRLGWLAAAAAIVLVASGAIVVTGSSRALARSRRLGVQRTSSRMLRR